MSDLFISSSNYTILENVSSGTIIVNKILLLSKEALVDLKNQLGLENIFTLDTTDILKPKIVLLDEFKKENTLIIKNLKIENDIDIGEPAITTLKQALGVVGVDDQIWTLISNKIVLNKKSLGKEVDFEGSPKTLIPNLYIDKSIILNDNIKEIFKTHLGIEPCKISIKNGKYIIGDNTIGLILTDLTIDNGLLNLNSTAISKLKLDLDIKDVLILNPDKTMYKIIDNKPLELTTLFADKVDLSGPNNELKLNEKTINEIISHVVIPEVKTVFDSSETEIFIKEKELNKILNLTTATSTKTNILNVDDTILFTDEDKREKFKNYLDIKEPPVVELNWELKNENFQVIDKYKDNTLLLDNKTIMFENQNVTFDNVTKIKFREALDIENPIPPTVELNWESKDGNFKVIDKYKQDVLLLDNQTISFKDNKINFTNTAKTNFKNALNIIDPVNLLVTGNSSQYPQFVGIAPEYTHHALLLEIDGRDVKLSGGVDWTTGVEQRKYVQVDHLKMVGKIKYNESFVVPYIIYNEIPTSPNKLTIAIEPSYVFNNTQTLDKKDLKLLINPKYTRFESEVRFTQLLNFENTPVSFDSTSKANFRAALDIKDPIPPTPPSSDLVFIINENNNIEIKSQFKDKKLYLNQVNEIVLQKGYSSLIETTDSENKEFVTEIHANYHDPAGLKYSKTLNIKNFDDVNIETKGSSLKFETLNLIVEPGHSNTISASHTFVNIYDLKVRDSITAINLTLDNNLQAKNIQISESLDSKNIKNTETITTKKIEAENIDITGILNSTDRINARQISIEHELVLSPFALSELKKALGLS